MKKCIAALTAAVALALTLAGCGGVKDAAAAASAVGDEMRSELRFRKMLANAHVHDSDGFLFDGENAHFDTF